MKKRSNNKGFTLIEAVCASVTENVALTDATAPFVPVMLMVSS